MTYLKYADLCATHVRNCLKEPAKTKAASASNMHARIIKWENGKRGAPEIVEKIAEAPAASYIIRRDVGRRRPRARPPFTSTARER